MTLPTRKPNRLPNYNYSQEGIYHITLCSKNKYGYFSTIQPGNNFSPPSVHLTAFGMIVEKYIHGIGHTYPNVTVDKYVIMPNHVHLLLFIDSNENKQENRQNEIIPFLISTLKRMTNKEAETNLWQRGYFDHVIRNKQDYFSVWQYIEDNPVKWIYDDYYIRG